MEKKITGKDLIFIIAVFVMSIASILTILLSSEIIEM